MGGSAVSDAKARILVIDDDDIILESLKEFLRLEGYEVDVAGTCREAVTALERNQYNLAITDINMPDAAGFEILRRVMVQATPSYAVKAYVEVGEGRSFSFPLVKLRPVEAEFYRFAGSLSLEELRRGLRVPGVDKRLMLIEPTERGHVESSVVGREGYVASRLGIDVRTVLDRVRALTRRDEVGRTGVFLKRELAPGECFEDVLRRLADRNPAVRRRLMEGTS